MYTDLYLKFSDEAEANSVLYTKEPTEFNEDGEPIAWNEKPNYMNIDVLGVLYEQQEDPEAEPVELPGYHVNVRVLATEDSGPLQPFSIQPAFPRRVWG